MAAKYFLNQTGLQYLINKILYGISAPKYSASSTYALGALVIYQGHLYKCSTAITVAEAWNAAHWTATTAAAELVTLNTNLNAQISSRKLLWTNPSPTSSFAGQTLTIDFKAYNFIELICMYGISGGEEVLAVPSIMIPKGKGAYIRFDDSTSAIKAYRHVTATSNSGIIIASAVPNNNYAIPYKIIGHIIS